MWLWWGLHLQRLWWSSFSPDTGHVPGWCGALSVVQRLRIWSLGFSFFFFSRTRLSYLLVVCPRTRYLTSPRLSLHSLRKQKQCCFCKNLMNEMLRHSTGWCPVPGLYEGLDRWLLWLILAIVVNYLPAWLHFKDQQVQAKWFQDKDGLDSVFERLVSKRRLSDRCMWKEMPCYGFMAF